MPHEITNHTEVLDAIRRTDIISELVEETDGKFKYETDLEVIAYGRNYTGKKVGPYAQLLIYEAGEEIVRQGDWGGNTFFFGIEGDLDVYVRDQSGGQKWVDVQKPGKSFGEMSVLAGMPRTATIVVPAGGKAKVLKMERPALRLLRKLPKFGQALDQVYRNNGLRRTVDDVLDLVDAPFNSELVKSLSASAQFKIYSKHQVLFRAGEPIKNLFIIRSGWLKRERAAPDERQAVKASLSTNDDEEQAGVDFLGAGNCLGLEGLERDADWKYTATLLAHTEVMEVPLSHLRADKELCDTLRRIFLQSRNGELRSQIGLDAESVAAAEKEIVTGLVDGSNLLVMDMDLCVRCGNCSLACHKVHGQSRLLRRGIHIKRPLKPGSQQTQHVLSPSVCLHCQDPECLTGCPTGAIARFPGGQIDINAKTCIGCGDCATQCPYSAISMVPLKPPPPEQLTMTARLKGWLSLAPKPLPAPVTEIKDLLAVKCNLCENTSLNPAGASRAAYSCEENCPTGALVRVNPREYFNEAGKAIGIVYQDQTHAIGRNIHKSDAVARLWHLCGVAATLALTIAFVWAARRYGLDGRFGESWLSVRWLTGFVGLAGIAGVMAYPARKQIYRRRAGALRYWMLAHVYLGVIAGLVLLLHGGRATGGLLTSLLMVAFDLVILSGLFGIACYFIVPRIMTSIEGDPLLVEDLETRREELRATLAGIGANDDELRRVIEQKVAKRFLSLSYLLRQYLRREELTDMLAGARAEFKAEAQRLTEPSARPLLIEAIETAATLRRVDALIYLHKLLKIWLAPHVVSTSLMLVLMLVHIIQVVLFSVR
ncbi:MAG: cyclic nucleotide-binding domain-containing protein [Acidobacteria bacterium]|nr:cyclic nucleotide-binding domain-containing protein [Acidobacteriota bacterium]